MSESKTFSHNVPAVSTVDSHNEMGLTALPQTNLQPEIMVEQLSDPQTTANNSDDTNIIPLNVIHEIPVKICAVLGKKKIDVASLINMKKGTVIDIDRKVGEPVDLYVNDTLVARGELIFVDGNLGVSMTEIIHNPNSQFPDHTNNNDQ